MTTKKREVDKIVLEFKKLRDTKRTHLFEEVLGEQTYSDKDIAIGSLYVQMQAIEMIGGPERIRVTIEPID